MFHSICRTILLVFLTSVFSYPDEAELELLGANVVFVFCDPFPDPGEYAGVYEKYSSENDEFDEAHDELSDELKALLQEVESVAV